jgi:predicted HAD superfamily Cof-like phosphohydrolase
MSEACCEAEVEADNLEIDVGSIPSLMHELASEAIDVAREEGYAIGRGSWQEDVQDFHDKFGCHAQCTPAEPPPHVAELRRKLIVEECNELIGALQAGDLIETADACADLIYVVLGTCVSYGIDLAPVWDAVQASNMAKENGGKSESGKVLKPAGWTPPDVAGLLREQGWQG